MKKECVTPLVSVIVPVYKVEKYLATCLNSLINQTYSNWEAILVDDGSPDRSGVICDSFASRDARFKVIHKPNGGLSSARNAGVPEAKGEYIFFLDSDDFLYEGTLKHLVKEAIEYNADIAECKYIRGADTVFPDINAEYNTSVYDNKTVFTKFAAKITTWGKLYKRHVIEGISFPEGVINEDDFTTWKFYSRAKRIVILSAPYYYYTYNPNSIMAQNAKRPDFKYFDAYRERIKFFIDRNEPDLEAVSRIHWLKTLVLRFSGSMVTNEQRSEIKEIFDANYSALRKLPFRAPGKLRLIFKAFSIAPSFTSRTVVKLYNR